MRRIIVGSILILAGTLGCQRGAPNPASPSSKPAGETKHTTTASAKSAIEAEEHLEAIWESKPRFTPSSQGADWAVVGRVRLFAAGADTPHAGDGKLTISLHDCTPRPGYQDPLLIDEWGIGADTLKSFLAENASVPEYLLVLPWSSYKKEIEQVRIDVKYEPKSGRTLVKEGEVLTLDHGDAKEGNSSQ